MTNLSRPTIHEYFMEIAFAAAKRSTCPRMKCGAVVTEEGVVVSTGYNGAPRGMKHCTEVGCNLQRVRERERCVRIVHAERNAVLQSCGRGDTLYTIGQPCYDCLMEVLTHGKIRMVWWALPYQDDERDKLAMKILTLPVDQRVRVDRLQRTNGPPSLELAYSLQW